MKLGERVTESLVEGRVQLPEPVPAKVRVTVPEMLDPTPIEQSPKFRVRDPAEQELKATSQQLVAA